MAEPQAKPGYLAAVLVGSTALAVETIAHSHTIDKDDVTTTFAQSGGRCAQRLLGNIERCTDQLSTVYDFSAGYWGAPLNLRPGNVITAFHAQPDGTLDFSYPALITSANWRSGPKNQTVRIDFTVESTGNLTIPAA